MLGLLENASFLVYLWSIYGRLVSLVGAFAFLSSCVIFIMCSVYFIMLLSGGGQDFSKIAFRSVPVKTIVTFWLFSITFNLLLPEKKYLPYIISASPVAKTIINSYTDGVIGQAVDKVNNSAESGKLHKVDEIIDKSLDTALRFLDENSKK